MNLSPVWRIPLGIDAFTGYVVRPQYPAGCSVVDDVLASIQGGENRWHSIRSLASGPLAAFLQSL